jgi:hypothetical protein
MLNLRFRKNCKIRKKYQNNPLVLDTLSNLLSIVSNNMDSVNHSGYGNALSTLKDLEILKDT